MLYWLLRTTAGTALRWYYRDIRVTGAECVPMRGPAILAANHNNALVDALLVGTAVRRKVRLTAKATLLAHPLTRWIAAGVGIVPLRRIADERAPGGGSPNTERNTQAFTAILDTLAAGGLVLIFPEGKSHSEPSLAPLKTGCARIALQAHLERGIPHLQIIPVGLTFEQKGTPRSRVLVQFAPPIAVYAFATDAGARAGEPQAVAALTGEVDRALRSVTLNFAGTREADRALRISTILSGLVDRVRPLHDADAPLTTAVQIAQRVERVQRLIPTLAPDTAREVDAFVERLDAFDARLTSQGVPVNDLAMPTSRAAGAWFALRESLVFALLAPISAWGRVNHLLPIALARRVARTTSATPDDPAMHTLVSGLVFVLLLYGAVASIVWWSVGAGWAMLYLASLPPSASLDFRLGDRLERARARARGYFALRASPGLQAQLLKEASVLREEAERLEQALR